MQTNPHLPGTADEFISENLGLAHEVAWEFIKRHRGNDNIKFDEDDIMSIAYVGLIKAYKKFDPTRFTGTDGGVIKFSSYAMPTIRGEIMKDIRDFGHTIRKGRASNKFFDVDSLDRPVKNDDQKSETLGDLVLVESYDVDEQVVVGDFLGKLGPRLQQVYRLGKLGLSQREIGNVIGLSQVSVSRMELYLLESAKMYGHGLDISERTRFRDLKAV